MNTMEAFMLVSINEKNGALLNARSMLTYGLAGIAVYELSNEGRISFDGKHVTLNSSSHTGNVFLDDTIDVMAKKQTAHKTSILVSRLVYKVNRFARRILENLEDSGSIKIEQSRFLGLIPYTRYVISRVNEQKKLVNEIREIIRNGEKKADKHKAFLISILSACSILHRLFGKEERKQYRDIFKSIRKGAYFETLDDVGAEVHKAVKTAIAAAQTAAA
jgi:hypothetical protein